MEVPYQERKIEIFKIINKEWMWTNDERNY